MAKMYTSAGELIGSTPLSELTHLEGLHARVLVKKRRERRKTIVVLLPDTDKRYLSTDMF